MDPLELQRGKEHAAMQITLRVNSYIFLFGLPTLLTAIILGSVSVSYLVTRPNVMMPNVTVQPGKIEATLQMPAQPATIVKAPDVIVQAPVFQPRITYTPPVTETPHINFTLPEGKPGEVKVIEKIVEKVNNVPVPVYIETSDKAVITLQDVYAAAEQYIMAQCKLSGKDPQAESKRWLAAWDSQVKEVGDEQRVANDALLNKRGGFDVAKAKTEEVVEVCRLMLRYRDAKLAVPSAFKTAMTADNLYKFKTFLEQGSKQ